MSLTRSQFDLVLAKYAVVAAGAKAGAGIFGKATNFFGGGKAVNRLTDAMRREHAFGVARSAVTHNYKNRGMWFGKRWLDNQYWKDIRNLKVKHGVDVPGGYWKNVGRNVLRDIRHPIRNIQDRSLRMMYKFDAKSGKLVPKTRGEITKSIAGAAAFPAAFTWMDSRDPNIGTGSLIGRGASYAAIPFAFKRTLPMMAAFSLPCKLFPSKPPIMGQGMPRVPR